MRRAERLTVILKRDVPSTAREARIQPVRPLGRFGVSTPSQSPRRSTTRRTRRPPNSVKRPTAPTGRPSGAARTWVRSITLAVIA